MNAMPNASFTGKTHRLAGPCSAVVISRCMSLAGQRHELPLARPESRPSLSGKVKLAFTLFLQGPHSTMSEQMNHLPYVKKDAQVLAQDGVYRLDWYTGVLTNHKTDIVPATPFYPAHFALIGKPVIALRLWKGDERLRTTYVADFGSAATDIYQGRDHYLESMKQTYATMPDADAFIADR